MEGWTVHSVNSSLELDLTRHHLKGKKALFLCTLTTLLTPHMWVGFPHYAIVYFSVDVDWKSYNLTQL